MDVPTIQFHPLSLQTFLRAPGFNHGLLKESLWINNPFNAYWGPEDFVRLTKAGNESFGIKIIGDMLKNKKISNISGEASVVIKETPETPENMQPNNAIDATVDWQMLSLEEILTSLESGMLPLPSDDNLACILRKCRKERSSDSALRLHAYMRKHGFESHPLVGNHLVVMLVDGGSLNDAHQVFDSLPFRNKSSWNSLIIGYVKCGESRKALNLYQMQEVEFVHSSVHTFVALLKTCAKLKDRKMGCRLHAEIARQGLLNTDPFVGSTLVDMYGKCGLLEKALEVFNELPVRDAASWNALISGFAHHDHGDQALNFFKQMQLEGISPNAITYVCVLKACGSVKATEKGKEIHAELVDNGLLRKHVIVGNALVDMYIKFGLLDRSQEVFDQLVVRDVVSWNSLIAGYAKDGQEEEALNCFDRLQHEGISPDSVSFICSLKACGSIGASDKGQQIHKQIAKTRLLESNLMVGNALIDMYAKCGMLEKAQEVFDMIPVRDLISWNSLITGYVKYDYNKEVLNCFEQLQHEGISPNGVTYVGYLKACSNTGAIDKGLNIHSDILKKGLETDVFLGSILLDTYAKCGWLAEAQEVFDKLLVQDVVSWTALIAGYSEHGCSEEALNHFNLMRQEGISPDVVTFICSLKACGNLRATGQASEIHAEIRRKGLETNLLVGNSLVDMFAKCGLLTKAQEVFDKLPVQDIVSWTALIGGYADLGEGDKALSCFEQMKTQGVTPNPVTYVASLKACGSIGAIEKGQEIHGEILQKRLLETDFVVGNALVDMYSKCGIPAKAQEVFEMLSVREIVSWNALIAGYAQQGEIENVAFFFERMIEEGIRPGLVTFVSVLNACNHTGLVDKGQEYFEAMRKEFGVNSTLEHYTCMVDLFCRAGQLGKASAMILKMPIYPDPIIWRSLLGACQKWGNVELGNLAFDQLLRLDKSDSAAFIGMSNIYADADIHLKL